jgi:hypothetical protein
VRRRRGGAHLARQHRHDERQIVADPDRIAGPGDGWATDAADGDDENEDPDLVLGGWYDYDFMTHVLTPRAQVVRTAQGNAFKLEILAYYDDAGTSGMLTIRWAPLIAQ